MGRNKKITSKILKFLSNEGARLPRKVSKTEVKAARRYVATKGIVPEGLREWARLELQKARRQASLSVLSNKPPVSIRKLLKLDVDKASNNVLFRLWLSFNVRNILTDERYRNDSTFNQLLGAAQKEAFESSSVRFRRSLQLVQPNATQNTTTLMALPKPDRTLQVLQNGTFKALIDPHAGPEQQNYFPYAKPKRLDPKGLDASISSVEVLERKPVVLVSLSLQRYSSHINVPVETIKVNGNLPETLKRIRVKHPQNLASTNPQPYLIPTLSLLSSLSLDSKPQPIGLLKPSSLMRAWHTNGSRHSAAWGDMPLHERSSYYGPTGMPMNADGKPMATNLGDTPPPGEERVPLKPAHSQSSRLVSSQTRAQKSEKVAPKPRTNISNAQPKAPNPTVVVNNTGPYPLSWSSFGRGASSVGRAFKNMKYEDVSRYGGASVATFHLFGTGKKVLDWARDKKDRETLNVGDALHAGASTIYAADGAAAGARVFSKSLPALSKIGAASPAVSAIAKKAGVPVMVAVETYHVGSALYESGGKVDRKVARTIGSAVGTIGAAAATGALVGSIVPGLGNVVGGLIGLGVGIALCALGSEVGGAAGEAIYDAVTHQ